MIRINRRKLLKLGFGGIFLLPVFNKKSIALDIEVNRFGDNKNINLDNINTVAIKIKNFNIISNNINYNKDVNLKITGKVGETNIGEIKDIDINIQDGKTNVKNQLNSDVIKLNNSELFSNDKYRPEKKELEIELKFRLDHSSLENPVTKDVIYTFSISGNGELVQHNFDNRNNKSLSNNNSINEFSDAKMRVFKNLSGDELSQKLIQSGSIINKSSENINSAISDIQQIPFDNNSIDQYPQISNSEPDDLSNNNSINEFSDAKMRVFKNLSGDELSQKLIQGGSIINKSSENINSAISDIQQIPYDNNSIDQYPQISNSEPDEMYY